MSSPLWGIVRYEPGRGPTPGEDRSAFDGWYTDREDARRIYGSWREQFPGWIVALVRGDAIRFPSPQVQMVPDWTIPPD
jgi:hypothetical protein